MNSKIYNSIIILLISSFGLMAQTKREYERTFEVDKTTQLRFQTRNIDVTFKTWNKDEVKIDFTVNFKNYSPEDIEKISNEIEVSARIQSSMDDTQYLQIENWSPTSIGRLAYTIKLGEIRLDNFLDSSDSKPNKYRSVANINKEIDAAGKGWQDMNGFVIFEDSQVALKDLENSNHKGVQSIRSSYEIYVPKYMEIDIMSENASVTFEGIISNSIRGSFKESTVKAEELSNEKNMFSFVNGNLKVKKITGGQLMLRNVTRGLIGEIANIALETEFSKIDIGEIKENVRFKDFKSKFFFYNLGSNFKSIDMFCEYSDIKLYTTKNQKFYMEAYGNNAILTDGNVKTVVQPSRDGTKSKILSRGKDDEETRKNFFKLDIVHGFVTFFYNK
ncbi:MAG: hypothetical protein AAF611_09755 [Bacteroidota bacterium]